MKLKLIFLTFSALCFFAVPFSVLAQNSQIWTPPPRKGTVYVIVQFTKGMGITPIDTNVSIEWGNWRKSGRFNPSGGRTPKSGVVIKLQHTKDDSVPMTVRTDGRILRIFQGDPPSEWSNGNWHTASW
ncbi:hypothetical protein [Leptolyngbya sp. 7M]|uniref:hypothetical protein n=1 Tax=Leptolyngbya sp. 7M TaxID=2812896 RepID=UPI001B8B3C78|nr:hypothetical protein [Leptolyngbya sp. 7M]QYO66692.1 hypothetical protein JVX88_07785 [Leptolyngbya sp. 7M]